MSNSRVEKAIELMNDFAQRTGITGELPARRYLWTDAFAVCNFLGLADKTGKGSYRNLALQLVDQVHHTLGQHRNDDPRSGWISGLNADEGEEHPTRGGLRIGKKLPERGPDAFFDERLEWDRDGQYFHYLTKWMHALDQVSRSTNEPRYNDWARELAEASYHAFTYGYAAGKTPRMYWKMSIDLTRPLVPSMGQHDPLDGYVTASQLLTTANSFQQATSETNLEGITHEFMAMTADSRLASSDPLGIGGLLIDVYRLYQLMQQGQPIEIQFLERLLSAAQTGLEYYANSGELRAPAEYRLAFRELGLAIGLQAIQKMRDQVSADKTVSNKIQTLLETLIRYTSLGDEIISFWRNSEHRKASTWIEHQDINEVMLATSLVPDGFLVLKNSSEPENTQ